MKPKKEKKMKYWAGFCDGYIAETLEYYGDRFEVLAIYKRKDDAKKHYEDVRLVEIRIISPKKPKVGKK